MKRLKKRNCAGNILLKKNSFIDKIDANFLFKTDNDPFELTVDSLRLSLSSLFNTINYSSNFAFID